MIPTPWVFVLLALVAYRLTRLLGWDDFPPIEKARNWILGANVQVRSRPAGAEDAYLTVYRRQLLAKLVHCAFCLGWWVALAVYLVWALAGHPYAEPVESWMFYVGMPFALAAAVGLIAKNLDP